MQRRTGFNSSRQLSRVPEKRNPDTSLKTADAPPTKAALRLVARERFRTVRRAQLAYARQLNSVAREVGKVVKKYSDEKGLVSAKGIIKDPAPLESLLARYSIALKDWARRVTQTMHAEVAQRDKQAWILASTDTGKRIKDVVLKSPVGSQINTLLEEQVDLITSLPLYAARRVHKLAQAAWLSGERPESVAKEILRTSKVTASRATLIARTEVARTAAVTTETRAKNIGCIQYIWRTANDSDVRELHRKLEGKVFRWDNPPVSGEAGERSNPGEIYNCRCWAEPILPDLA